MGPMELYYGSYGIVVWVLWNCTMGPMELYYGSYGIVMSDYN